MSSDSIHDAVLCAERRGRTPARSIDAALLARLYTHNCDYLMINAVSLRHYLSIREALPMVAVSYPDAKEKFRYSRSLQSVGAGG